MVVAAGMLAAGAAARAADLKSEVLGNLQSEDPAIRDAAAKAVISNPSLGTNVVSDIEAIAQQFIADDQRKGTAKTAILLLGKLKSKRSIPFLIEHMTFYVPYRPGRLESIRGACPCVAALIDIGEPAFPAVLARGLKDDDMGIERCLKIIFLHAKNKTAAREFLAESLEKLKTENARNKVKDLLDFLPKDSPTPTPTVKKSEPQPVAVKESAPQSVTVNGVTYTAPLKPTP
ncbi:MAG: hypothetical protein HZC54_11980 [Verrucomicrobia bacterium]|nr:hypothetical protein [Verrucomicrobiota bacterium]